MNKLLSTRFRWLISAIFVLAACLVSLAGAERTAAHGYPPSSTPVPSPTTTPTPPVIQACQVTDVSFDRDTYLTGDTIRVTVTVADNLGAPLVGANVAVEVNRQPLAAQQIEFDSIDLIDRSGTYDGAYSQTELPGDYVFSFTVADPTGSRFLPCYAEATVRVEAATPTPTFTPTATPSPTPTATPTFTPTPEPLDTVVQVVPETLQTTLCSLRDVTTINVAQVARLAAMELEITYDPTVIQVIDADRSQRGVQVRYDPIFSTAAITQNSVDTDNGRIVFAANLVGGQTIDGARNLIAIDWRPQRVGITSVVLARVVLRDGAGQPLPFQVQNGMVEVNFVSSCAFGTVALQQRADHGGVVVTNGAGQQTFSLPDGSFGIPTSEMINFEFPGFLSARANLSSSLATTQGEAGQMASIDLGAIPLLAGDINGDNVVNILDLAYVASNFQSNDGQADLNADGVVNIFDLVTVAGNYQRQGPATYSFPN